MSSQAEATDTFACFGSSCTIHVSGDGREGSAHDAVELARSSLLDWHGRFSRFEPDSELSRLNRDPRQEVPVSPLMARFAQAVARAGSLSGGLVDATLTDDIETAGYRGELADPPALSAALALAPARRAAQTAAARHWAEVEVDLEASTVTRPPGVRLDSGGLAKGMFADVLAETLATHAAFAVNCAGDLAIGGREGVRRPVRVESPFDGSLLHTFTRRAGGVATSGIGRRRWSDGDGLPAHHLLDPSTGRPAFTGIVQVTAFAASALEAEIRTKAAILSGPRAAAAWLRDGGVIVLDDGSHVVIDPPPLVTLSRPPGTTRRHLSLVADGA